MSREFAEEREGPVSVTSTSQPVHAPAAGARKRRRLRRRAPTARGALLVTLAGALLPGAGFLYSRRRVLGWTVLIAGLLVVAAGWWFLPHNLESALKFAADPGRVRTATLVVAVLLVLWVVVVVTTFLAVRPKPSTRWRLAGSSVVVAGLCLTVAVPTALVGRSALAQADLVETVFAPQVSATVPRDVTPVDPWGGRDRVNVLLLGGDGSETRDGLRTDSMILMSVDTSTGRAVTFSLPRNMMNAPFPSGTALHDLYPSGFSGYGDPAAWMLNAVYGQVPVLNPGAVGRSDNPGADALKLAIQGTTGLQVHYYVLVNLEGFRHLIDAMGGVTVNVNSPVAIGGDTDAGVPPDDYLDPGPDQHLSGFEALWFARGRYGSDDYERMERQRCLVDAIVDQVDPINLLRRFPAIVEASKDSIFTDIPQDLLPAFVDLALKTKETRVRSVVFRSSEEFFPGDPDFAWLQERVRAALEPGGGSGQEREPAEVSRSRCAYTGSQA